MIEESQWLVWVRQIRSIAQAGLSYSEGPYDLERYASLRTLAAEITAQLSGLDMEQLEELYAAERGYETPKVDVRGVVFQDRKVLLVRELSDEGRWTLPGGWADVGDKPSLAVEREVWEESGYRTRATKLLATYDRRFHGHHPPALWGIYKLFFRCEVLTYEPIHNIETAEGAFFAENEIPELSTGRTTEKELHRMFEHYDHPDLATDFD